MNNLVFLRNIFHLTQEELAKKINLDKDTIAKYEAGKITPSFKTLKKLSFLYQISFDFLIGDKDCFYPRNLYFLRLAKKLDKLNKSDARNTIQSSAKSLLTEKINREISIKNDNNLIDLNLVDNFHLNLRELRKFNKINQINLARQLNISRSGYSQYEVRNYPSINNLIRLSKILNTSIHALATGDKLTFNFANKQFESTILLADHFLTLEHQKVLITLMEAM